MKLPKFNLSVEAFKKQKKKKCSCPTTLSSFHKWLKNRTFPVKQEMGMVTQKRGLKIMKISHILLGGKTVNKSA